MVFEKIFVRIFRSAGPQGLPKAKPARHERRPRDRRRFQVIATEVKLRAGPLVRS